MPFGIIGRTGPGMRQVVEFGDRSTGRGTFGGKFGARVTNGNFTACVCDGAATRPSSQIILGKLVYISSNGFAYDSLGAIHWFYTKPHILRTEISAILFARVLKTVLY